MPITASTYTVPTPMTLGCDVSFWQDDNSTVKGIDFVKMHEAGAKFVFIRAGQYIHPDPDFNNNWRASKAAGLLRGAYLFFDYRFPAVNQANMFAARLAGDPGELPPVLDIEYRAAWGRPTRDAMLAAINAFLLRMRELGHKRVIFYSNPDMLLSLAPVPEWLSSQCPLWIAHYGVSAPRHDGWPAWTFWQYTDRGDGESFGVESKQLDMDWFNGSEAALHQFAVGAQEPTYAQALDTWARSMGFTGPPLP